MIEQRQGYSTTARVMHWIIAVLVLLMIPAGITMIQEGISRPLQDTLFLFHKNTGVIVLLLMVARLLYRRAKPPPPLPATVPDWQRRAAGLSHGALYVLLFVMPISGYVRVRAERYPIEGLDALGIGTLLPHSKALAGFAQGLHQAAAFLLIAVLLVHIGAALQHAFIRKDGVFSRMWPPFER
ncbi:cytochrome b [Tropicimonas isoalkanivorans]|uniref:Cytochrome b561 n=1 Tax=Tropicimonas isoalkanivorans TaxID=441112 RepID=A0A1I1LJJ5_9RHOB|nr:cytochrome b [Tropicimonas isoalkanivorans]SFC73367.1 cytochrome b561 [Tropicimonas isoalkanivorans]